MNEHDIHICDTVTSRNYVGIFTVKRTQNTVGIMRPQDEMMLQGIEDEDISGPAE